jgi:hypothetical protein
MTKELIDKIVTVFEEKKIHFKLDTHINHDKSYLRGIIVYNPIDKGRIYEAIGKDNLKEFKIMKTYLWYLGEKKKAILLKLKEELILEIPDVESYEISSIA